MFIPFLDHIIHEFDSRFNDRDLLKLFSLSVILPYYLYDTKSTYTRLPNFIVTIFCKIKCKINFWKINGTRLKLIFHKMHIL